MSDRYDIGANGTRLFEVVGHETLATNGITGFVKNI